MSLFKHTINQKAIVEKYFSSTENEIRLAKGDVLLNQYEINHRLFYVRKGKVCGFLPDKHISEPVFEASADSFVGVYSFFSEDHRSYSKVVADEDAIIYYLDGDTFDLTSDDSETLLMFLFKIVIAELRSRQHFAGQMAHEHENTLHKLIQTEKLATLGQMSAGLAHELNNTIGSLSGNLRQLEEDLSFFIMKEQSENIQKYYLKGLEEGQQMSSIEARKARTKWDKFSAINKTVIKRLAKSGIDPKEVPDSTKAAEKIASFWNLGFLIHDMKIAADQASHVISSIKTMGISSQNWSKDVDVNATLKDALAIIRSITKNIDLKIATEENLPVIEACHGELIQVWINLIKNAIESLVHHKVQNPTVWVTTSENKNSIILSVEDNGIGIPANIIEKIYDPSFTTKVRGISLGLGVGLTIVQRIVDEHEGTIVVSSIPGKTKFKISIKKQSS